jgi:hypothetical protein
MYGARFLACLVGILWVAAGLAAAAESGSLMARTVIINEVEINPNGFDRDAEWVELLNVGTTSVDLAGWSLSYDYPTDGVAMISAGSLILRPGQRYVFLYSGLRLRNDDKIVLRLLDAAGKTVDEAGPFHDDEDDGKTWQFIPDGGDPTLLLWLFRGGTKNAANK